MKHRIKATKGSISLLAEMRGSPPRRGNVCICPGETGLSPAQGGQKSKISHSLWLLWLLWGQRVPVNEQKGSAWEMAQEWKKS